MFYRWMGWFQVGAAACRAAADRLRTDDSGGALRVRARILAWQSVFDIGMGQTRSAAGQLRHSLALLEEPSERALDVRPERAFVRLQLGYALRFLERGRAEEMLQHSLAL